MPTAPRLVSGWSPKAQTILQLFDQLSRRGFDLDALQRTHRAYSLTVALTTCQYRSSGRTQIDHAVGVTSVLIGAGAERAAAHAQRALMPTASERASQ